MTNELCKLRNGIQDATLGHRKASRAIENRIVKMMTIKCRLLSPLAFSAAHTVSTSKFSLFPFVRQSQSHSLDRTPLFPFSMHPCTMHGGWKISTLNRVAAIRPTTKWQTREVFAISTYFRKFIFRFSVSDFQIILSIRADLLQIRMLVGRGPCVRCTPSFCHCVIVRVCLVCVKKMFCAPAPAPSAVAGKIQVCNSL